MPSRETNWVELLEEWAEGLLVGYPMYIVFRRNTAEGLEGPAIIPLKYTSREVADSTGIQGNELSLNV